MLMTLACSWCGVSARIIIDQGMCLLWLTALLPVYKRTPECAAR